METFFIRTVQLIFSLSILVFLHELGHFAFARLFKVRVDKFYMFFNPQFSLVRAKKINGRWQVKFFAKNVPVNERPKLDADGDVMVDKKGKTVMEIVPVAELPEGDWRKYPDSTEWGIGWLPLGGYCKIAGMVDESMDTTQLTAEPQKWEYRSRSVWQRLPIIIGGVLVNFILAMVIYSAILFTWGQEILPLSNAKYGLQFSPVMLKHGFQNGDNIISVNGQRIEQRGDLIEKILIEGKEEVVVVRNKEKVKITLPPNFTQEVLKAEENDLISIRFPFVIEEISSGSAAEVAQLQYGDSIIAVNGKTVTIFQDIASELDANRNKMIELSYVRDEKIMHTSVQLSETAKLGVGVRTVFNFIKTEHITYGFFESIPAGITFGWETLSSYVKQLKIVFTKEGSKQLGGFGAIGKMFPSRWDWQVFWSMTALLSIILAFMNFLPIPGLDGGYVMFILYEIISGRKPNDKFLEYAQTVGFMLLMALVLYSNGNDLYKALFK
jgi:regulator of sigma E protease